MYFNANCFSHIKLKKKKGVWLAQAGPNESWLLYLCVYVMLYVCYVG